MKFSKNILKAGIVVFGLVAMGNTAFADNSGYKQHSREWYNEQWKKNHKQKKQHSNTQKYSNSQQHNQYNNHNQHQNKKQRVLTPKPRVVSHCKSGYNLYIHKRSNIKRCLPRGGNEWRLYGNHNNKTVAPVRVVPPKRVVRTKQVVRPSRSYKRCNLGFSLFYHKGQNKYECFQGPRRGWVGIKTETK